MRSILLVGLLLLAATTLAPAASAGWVSACAPKMGCVAAVCATGCGRDTLACFAVGPTAPVSCVTNPCPPDRCYPAL
ncbi:MAG: hypothetical protein QOE90_3302 [Thermoplasmata archaeon]|jgi:hypothetical protein|nr:hypothetical protein [Thermoplasmata archaeon]